MTGSANAASPPQPRAAERILKTARELFYKEGIRAVGVDTIASEAGVTKPTLYRCFDSKDELAAAYVRVYDAEFWARFEGAGVDPKGWIKVRSEFAITNTLDLDVRLRHYDQIPTLTADGYSGAPSYTQADARLAWRVRPNLELSLVGQNLLDSQHPEASETRRSEIPRSVFAGLRWSY